MEMLKIFMASAALALSFAAGGSAFAQDAEVNAELAAEGESVFRRCAACHQVGPEAQNRVGPTLTGVVGREAAAVEGYDYSEAMTEAAAGGLVWTEEELDPYLENPREHVPGTKMSFAGLRDEEDRLAVIEYLKQQSM